jgi:hypothetical protein
MNFFEFKRISSVKANFSTSIEDIEKHDFFKDMCQWEETEMFISFKEFHVTLVATCYDGEYVGV